MGNLLRKLVKCLCISIFNQPFYLTLDIFCNRPVKTFILKAFLKPELLTGSHFVSHAYRKRCLHLHRQQNRNRRNPCRASSRFSRLSHSHPAHHRFHPVSSAGRAPFHAAVSEDWSLERGRILQRGRKGRSLITIIIITFTPFIISKHHHHQRDEACLRSLETYRNTKPAAAAAAPNKMNRINRTPSPDAVWCSTFYYLFIFWSGNFSTLLGVRTCTAALHPSEWTMRTLPAPWFSTAFPTDDRFTTPNSVSFLRSVCFYGSDG